MRNYHFGDAVGGGGIDDVIVNAPVSPPADRMLASAFSSALFHIGEHDVAVCLAKSTASRQADPARAIGAPTGQFPHHLVLPYG
jgi:hypothetical protein